MAQRTKRIKARVWINAPTRCNLRDMDRFPTTADRLKAWRKANPAKPISEEVKPSIGGKEGFGRDGFGFGTPMYYGNPPTRYQGPEDSNKPNSREVDRWHYCKEAGHGFRHVGYADEVCRHIKHTGWFTDNFQGERMRGIVAQIPAKDGTPRYVAGCEHSDWDCHTIDLDTFYDDKEDAAKAADSMAESMAEQCREDEYRESVKAREVDNRQAIRESLAEYAQIRASLGQTRDKTARRVLRERLESEKANRDKLRREIEKLDTDPYSVLGY